jgi:hypothetical protein
LSASFYSGGLPNPTAFEGAMTTTAVELETAVTSPTVFVAVTATRIVEPTSLAVTV